MRKGFTLIELLLVIGIIAILAGVVIAAINPTKQLADSADAQRNHRVNQIKKAMMQHMIDHGELPGDTTIPTGEENAFPICRSGVADVSCINLDDLVPMYMSCMPKDGAESDTNLTGFTVYQRAGFVTIQSTYLATNSSATGDCETPPEPIAYWQLDEGGINASIIDVSGGGHDGQAVNFSAPNGPSDDVPTLKFTSNKSLSYDGTDDYVAVPHNDDFNFETALSISAWIKPESFDAADSVNSIVRKGDDNPNRWQLAIEDGLLTIMLDSGDGNNGRAQGATLLVADTWYHVAGTWDGTTARVYVDGVEDGSGIYTTPLSISDARDIYIGGRINADSFDGYIDDVRVYNQSLPQATITNLANGNP